jgi:hypothetical protein
MNEGEEEEEEEEGICPNVAVIGRRDVLWRSHDRSFPLSRSCMVQKYLLPSTSAHHLSLFFIFLPFFSISLHLSLSLSDQQAFTLHSLSILTVSVIA